MEYIKSGVSVLPYTLPFGRTVPPLARLVSSPLESRVLRSLLPPVSGNTASSVPLAPGSSLKTGLSSSSSGILSRLSSEILERACSFFRRPGGNQAMEGLAETKYHHQMKMRILLIGLAVFTEPYILIMRKISQLHVHLAYILICLSDHSFTV